MSDGIFILITVEFFGFLFLPPVPHVDDVVFIAQDCLTFCVFMKMVHLLWYLPQNRCHKTPCLHEFIHSGFFSCTDT